jgi:hypothetical protein
VSDHSYSSAESGGPTMIEIFGRVRMLDSTVFLILVALTLAARGSSWDVLFSKSAVVNLTASGCGDINRRVVV